MAIATAYSFHYAHKKNRDAHGAFICDFFTFFFDRLFCKEMEEEDFEEEDLDFEGDANWGNAIQGLDSGNVDVDAVIEQIPKNEAGPRYSAMGGQSQMGGLRQ